MNHKQRSRRPGGRTHPPVPPSAIKVVTSELASFIEPKLPAVLPLPAGMIEQVAEAEIGLIRVWLSKEMPVTAAELAAGLHRGIRGIVSGYATDE